MSERELTAEELERYSRQIGPGVLTPEAQVRLRESTVLVSRAGGMGGPAALALTMAGVGRIILAHGGRLESPDLNRMILGCEAGVGQERVGRFAEFLRSRSRFVEVEAINHEPDDAEALALARRSDLVLSCPPGFAERMRLNAVAVQAGKPLLDAAQWGMTGTLIAVGPGQTACLRCIYPADPPFEEFFPVVGAIAFSVGSLAALEAIKLLSGVGASPLGRMWMIDGFHDRVSIVQLTRRPDCPVCGQQ